MIGSVIEKYRIVEKIGEGGMGAVYKAVDLMLEREVAIKVLHGELARRPDIVERFRSEAVALARLQHPNIATIFELSHHNDLLFMAMEFVRGETLENLIQKAGSVLYTRAVPLCCQVLEALEYAHAAGVVHRDIKPSNLMISPAGSIKVMDFGIARVLGTQRKTVHGHIVGTLTYMSPEQVRGEEVDQRSDLYSLAVVLYELLTGTLPFTADTEYALMMSQLNEVPQTPRAVMPNIPDWLDEIVMRALEKAPQRRFQSAPEFRAALQAGMYVSRPAAGWAPAAAPTGTASSMPDLRESRQAGSWAAPPSGAIRETRLADAPPTSYPEIDTPSSVWAGLNWKHYTGAAAALVLLIAIPAALLLLREKPAPTRSEPESQTGPDRPAQFASAPTEPAAVPPPAWRPETVPSPVSPTPSAPGDSSGRTPATRRPKTVEPPTRPTAAEEKPAPTPPPPPVAETPAIAPPSIAPPPPSAPAEETRSTPAPMSAHVSPVTFQKVKAVLPKGDKSTEIDAVLEFTHDRLVVTGKDGEAIKSFRYGSIASAIYSQSKHPRWKGGLGAAAAVGVFATPVFFMKGTKHWLTVQTENDYLVLRLDKDNYKTILPAFETRTGVNVEREKEEK